MNESVSVADASRLRARHLARTEELTEEAIRSGWTSFSWTLPCVETEIRLLGLGPGEHGEQEEQRESSSSKGSWSQHPGG